MSYAEKHLAKNEKIIVTRRPSWAPVIVGLIWFPPILAFIVRLIRRATTELTLTDSRIIGKGGIIRSFSLDAKLDKIQNISVKSGLFGKIFGYGTIVISTAGTAEGGVKFIGIGKAESLKQQIMAQVDIAQEEKTKAQAQEMARAMASAMNK
ncbi:MAG: PH domain-containing protein [Clostridia bacterium]|nr:PH domain-containing protein [Clostridia bacterium]